MPLLSRGPEVFPRSLFELLSTDYPWLVAQTKSRQEKALARHLEPLSVPFYLPTYEKRTVRSGRRFASYLPLFPGYVFLRADPALRATVFRTGLVVRLLEVRDQDLLQVELRQLRQLQESGARLVPFAPLVVGDRVIVAEGAFRGYRGRVLREQSATRLIVSISILRQSVAVEFERASLTRVPGEARPDAKQGAVA